MFSKDNIIHEITSQKINETDKRLAFVFIVCNYIYNVVLEKISLLLLLISHTLYVNITEYT